jgi:hypothetical protein
VFLWIFPRSADEDNFIEELEEFLKIMMKRNSTNTSISVMKTKNVLSSLHPPETA